jgi:hypothetical protein
MPQIPLISRGICIGTRLLAHTFPWCHSARTGLSGWMWNMVVYKWYLCIASEVNGNMLSGCILVCHSMTYLSINLFHITTTQHHTNTITELFICFFMLHKHFHCLLRHLNTVTVGVFTAFLRSEIHFAEVTKEWGIFAINWPYELVVGLCSCMTFLRDSREAVSGACCWALLQVASIMY